MNSASLDLGPRASSFHDFARSVFRHKKKVLTVVLAIFALGALIIFYAPRAYRSEAKLFLQVGRESVKLDPTATTGQTISMQQSDRSNEIATVIDVLHSRGIIEQVVDTLGPEVVLGRGSSDGNETSFFATAQQNTVGAAIDLVKSIDPISAREEAIIRLDRNLVVWSENNSTLIAVSYDTSSPQLAQLVAQTLVDIYRQEHLRLHRTSGSKEFFAEQQRDLEAQLDEAVDQLRIAKNELNMVSIESRRVTLENRLGSIELGRLESLQQLAGVRARIADLERQLGAIPERMVSEEKTVPNTGADALREQLYALQVLLLEQESKYNDDHPALQATRDQVRQAEAMLAGETPARQETTSDVNPNYRSLTLSLAEAQSELAAVEARQAQLAEQRQSVLTDLKFLNDHELSIDRLTREAQLAREKFFRYSENLEQARIDEALDRERISNLTVAQRATLAEKPVRPNKLLVGALSLVLALAAAAALVCLCELVGNQIYTEDQLRRSLPTPVLGVVPVDRKLAQAVG
jgi:uncharacterized protein involved in exopolysaccharide biosynthesis